MLMKMMSSLRQEGPRRATQRVLSYVEDMGFDRRHGLDTKGFIELDELDIPEDERVHGNPYMATRVRHSRQMLSALDLPPDPVFVDIGCGKGRMLCIASELGFERLVGVEFSAELAEIARRNADVWAARFPDCGPISVETCNAVEFPIDPAHNVFYIFRSFDRSIAEQVVDNVVDSLENHPRRVLLVFSYYVYGDMFDTRPVFSHSDTIRYGGAEFTVFEADTARSA